MNKQTYQIQYTDNTYRMVDWTQDEFEKVSEYMEAEARVISLDGGIFRLTDVRAIVIIPLVPEETPKEDENQLSEYGFTDPETQEWLRQMGVDITKGGSRG